MNDAHQNKYVHLKTKVGGGYYSLRKNSTKSKTYTKLVKTDRSPITGIYIDRDKATKPIIGHNPRRERILTKRKLKQKGVN